MISYGGSKMKIKNIFKFYFFAVFLIVLLSLPNSFARYDGEDDIDDYEDTITIKGRLMTPRVVNVIETAERIGLNEREKDALMTISTLIDVSEYNDSEIRTRIERWLASNEGEVVRTTRNVEVDEREVSSTVEEVNAWVRRLDLNEREHAALRSIAILIDISELDENTIRQYIERQISATAQKDDVDVDSREPVQRPDASDEMEIRPISVEVDRVSANERVREAFENSLRAREETLERLRSINENAVERLEETYERVTETQRAVLDRLDDERKLALMESDVEDIDAILILSASVLQRLSPSDLRNPEIRDSLIERAKDQMKLEYNRRIREQEVVGRTDDEVRSAREEAEQRVSEVTARVEERRKNLIESRSQFQDNADNVLRCVREDNLDCASEAGISRDHILSVLGYLRDNIESELINLESSNFLTEEQKNSHKERLRRRFLDIDSLLERLDNVMSFADVRDVGNDANRLSETIRNEIQDSRNARSSNAVNGLIAQTTALRMRLDRVLSTLANLEVDVSGIDRLISEFSDNLELVYQNQREIEGLMEVQVEPSERREHSSLIIEQRQEIRQLLQESRELLHRILTRSRDLANESGLELRELMG